MVRAQLAVVVVVCATALGLWLVTLQFFAGVL